MIKLLLANGANINHQNKKEKRLLLLLLIKYILWIIDTLISSIR